MEVTGEEPHKPHVPPFGQIPREGLELLHRPHLLTDFLYDFIERLPQLTYKLLNLLPPLHAAVVTETEDGGRNAGKPLDGGQVILEVVKVVGMEPSPPPDEPPSQAVGHKEDLIVHQQGDGTGGMTRGVDHPDPIPSYLQLLSVLEHPVYEEPPRFLPLVGESRFGGDPSADMTVHLHEPPPDPVP